MGLSAAELKLLQQVAEDTAVARSTLVAQQDQIKELFTRMRENEEVLTAVKTRQDDCRESHSPSVVQDMINNKIAERSNEIAQASVKAARMSVVAACVIGIATIITSLSIAAFWPSNTQDKVKGVQTSYTENH